MKKYRLTKVSDDVFDGKHPNDISEGYIREGELLYGLPKVGESFYISMFFTSVVTIEMNEEGMFETLNSKYKLEELDIDMTVDGQKDEPENMEDVFEAAEKYIKRLIDRQKEVAEEVLTEVMDASPYNPDFAMTRPYIIDAMMRYANTFQFTFEDEKELNILRNLQSDYERPFSKDELERLTELAKKKDRCTESPHEMRIVKNKKG